MALDYFNILRRLPSVIRRQPAAEVILKRLARNVRPVVTDLTALYTLFKPEADELKNAIVEAMKAGKPLDKAIPDAIDSTVHKVVNGLLPGALTVEEEMGLADRLSRE